MERSNFVLEHLSTLKVLTLEVGFKKLSINNVIIALGISKTKFFNLFGSIYGIMELMIFNELSMYYNFILLNAKQVKDYGSLELDISRLRILFLQKNSLLITYFSEVTQFTARFNHLKKAVEEHESNLLKEFLKSLSQTRGLLSLTDKNIKRLSLHANL